MSINPMQALHERFCRKFLKDTSGNVAVIAGLAIIPLISVAGLAIDFQLVVTKKNTVQQTLDATMISAARERQAGLSDSQIEAYVDEYFDSLLKANDPSLRCPIGAEESNVFVQFSPDSEMISGTVNCAIPTTLSSIFGRDEFEFAVTSGSTFGIANIDVAFVFDVSGSMRGDRLDDLQDAAKLAFEALLPEDAPTNDTVRIALTSYNHSINAGQYFDDVVQFNSRSVSLGNSEVTGDLYPENYGIVQFDQGSVTTGNYRRFSDYETVRSDGVDFAARYYYNSTCVFDRTGQFNAFGDLDDDFNFFTDDEPDDDNWLYPGQPEWDYLTNRGGENSSFERNAKRNARDEIQDLDGFVRTSSGQFNVSDSDDRVNSNAALDAGVVHTGTVSSVFSVLDCPPLESAPLPLTPRQNDLDDYVDDMVADGGTAGHLGIQWGWYLLSPKWANIWPTASEPLGYSQPETAKAMIIMTDGQFVSNHARTPEDSNELAADTCDAIKEDTNIVIFTVGFETPQLDDVNGSNKNILEYCATSDEHVFNADNGEELIEAYAAIAAEISDLRISN